MRARFVAATALGLALGAACTGDLFHATDDWATLCEIDASAPPCRMTSTSTYIPMPDAGPTPLEMKCHTYCAFLHLACPDQFNPLIMNDDDAIASCTTECTHLPDPAPTDRLTGMNTIDCRLAHAKLAAKTIQDGGPACAGASLAGDGICGDNCDTFCILMNQPPCDGDLGLVGNPDGGAKPTCKELCEAWTGFDKPYSYASAALTPQTEFDCHFLHATLAEQPNPPECTQAGAASTDCVPPPPDASM